jgi:prophage maintenance system killer protein
MERLGVTEPGTIDEPRLRSSLDRAAQMMQGGRGDIISLASFLLFGLVRDKPFGEHSAQTGIALTLAFLLRNGVAIDVDPEELAGLGIAVSRGEVYAGMLEMWMRESARPLGR